MELVFVWLLRAWKFAFAFCVSMALWALYEPALKVINAAQFRFWTHFWVEAARVGGACIVFTLCKWLYFVQFPDDETKRVKLERDDMHEIQMHTTLCCEAITRRFREHVTQR